MAKLFNYNHRQELAKFEVKDIHRRQYLKQYLENLPQQEMAKLNSSTGNILQKALDIQIPDYNQHNVVRRVMSEWEQLQGKIMKIKETIEGVDREIDHLVYRLYGLTGEEIMVVEKVVED